nr:MAG TPA: hypothetical protein [Caudoviricetes sp.]
MYSTVQFGCSKKVASLAVYPLRITADYEIFEIITTHICVGYA